MDMTHFRIEVIRPALKRLELWSMDAEFLLAGTALMESRFVYLRQLGGGPALGLYQVEPRTMRDVFDNYLAFRPVLRDQVELLMTAEAPEQQLITNLSFATAMARLVYRRSPLPLPAHDDAAAVADVWKRAYNTHLGAGDPAEFAALYRTRVLAA